MGCPYILLTTGQHDNNHENESNLLSWQLSHKGHLCVNRLVIEKTSNFQTETKLLCKTTKPKPQNQFLKIRNLKLWECTTLWSEGE